MKKLLAILVSVLLLATMIPLGAVSVSAHSVVMTASEFINCLQIAMARPNTYNNEYPYNLGYYNGSTISWDCWNLGKSIIWSRGSIVNNYSVGTHSRVDTSCGLGDWDGLTIVQQAPNCSSNFSNLVPGEWLYMSGHTGYYIGNGQVIECTTGWGVNGITQSQIDSYGNRSRNGVSGGKWLYHGMVPWLDYSSFIAPCTHTYSNACDTTCNSCGATRTITHNYAAATCTKPQTCTVCGATSGSALGHTYDNACDATCNTCGSSRTPSAHVYSNACDDSCNVCGATRTASAHVYDNACDATCNICGATRSAAHTYSDDCDADCNVCGAKREAMHNFVVTTKEATCIENEKICYTCTDCGYYYEEIVPDYVSDWSTIYPSDVDEDRIESKEQYRSRDKEWKESTQTLSGDWVLSNTETYWGSYGAWSGWDVYYIAANDSTQVETRTAYTYYYFQCPNCGNHMYGWDIPCFSWADGCGAYIPEDAFVWVYSPTSYDGVQEFHGTGKYYKDIDGQRVFRHDNGAVTQYRSRTRALETKYTYYRYTAWSDWQDVRPSSATEVETRTVYRYTVSGLGDHTYSGVCDVDCNVCGEKREASAHNYSEDIISNVTCVEDGVCVYTCSVCGDSYTVITPATGEHDYSFLDGYNPTCGTDGMVTYACSMCGDQYTVITPATDDHAYVEQILTPATCGNAGVKTHTCSVCGDNYAEVIPATGEHSYDDRYDGTCNGCTTTRPVPGDVNNDGKINNRDLGLMQQYLNDWGVVINTTAADFNENGAVNNRDLGELQMYLNSK